MRTPSLSIPTVLCAFLLILTGGCASNSYEPDASHGTEAHRQSLRVLVQICMPTGFASDYLSMFQVDRYGDRGEMRSVGGSTEKRIGFSASGQAVFEKFTHERHVDLVAIIVNVGNTAYTFDIAKAKPTLEGWTGWMTPWSQNDRNEMVWLNLAHARDFTVTPPDKEAPKARYRLVRTADWWNKVPRHNDERPGC